jgi:excinuclease ABC subunit A
MTSEITVRGARLHNLKNITVRIPKERLVVLTGVSGSGKSTLGFDILHKEGQRQYIESLGLAAFGLAKPPVDAITGLSPSISIDQHLTNRSPRSTVGTVTDVFTYLRVLFARLGHRPCPHCGQDVPPSFDDSGEGWDDDADPGVAGPADTSPCPHCGQPVPQITMGTFSFNKIEGACPTCTGLGTVHEANISRVIDEQKSILDGAVAGWNAVVINYHAANLAAAGRHYGFEFDPARPVRDFGPAQRDLLLYGVESPRFRRHFPNAEPPATVRQGRFEGVATNLLRRYAEHLGEHVHEADYEDKLEEMLVTRVCPGCGGTRLRPESRAVTVNGQNIIEVSALPLSDLSAWVARLESVLRTDERLVAESILENLRDGISRLLEVGVGYLAIDRGSTTLSAGEAQRLRLASLLASGLTGVLYVFDEPTIGLHHRDTHRLIDVLARLRDLGNTVLVIEHDLDVISAADHVVDFGPGAGKHGGEVVAAGTPAEVAETAGSLTGDYLSGREAIPIPAHHRAPGDRVLVIRGAREHNLKDLTVAFPLDLFVAVTGVSGSGKSTLVFDVLDPAVRQRLRGGHGAPGKHDSIEGSEHIDKIITIDQAHIGRIPRSNAATYSETFTPIREAFAAEPEARQRGFAARHFSFNVPGGRCERCEGAGVLTVKMQLLPDVEVRCPACHGRRFTHESLAVHYRGHDISQVLDMTVDEALSVFEEVPAARTRLQVLSDVGLGYLQLGQPATTLSGGEAQRIKLARELGRRGGGRTLYLLDEPTTGLHLADTARLLNVLQRLVDAGNTVIVVEHNLELVKAADWVIDLGPEGGIAGGELVAAGTPEEVARTANSYTGQGLAPLLRRHA